MPYRHDLCLLPWFVSIATVFLRQQVAGDFCDFSRTAKSLARVDLPAAIFPQKKINFAGVLMLVCA
jgi:hypothetical protein